MTGGGIKTVIDLSDPEEVEIRNRIGVLNWFYERFRETEGSYYRIFSDTYWKTITESLSLEKKVIDSAMSDLKKRKLIDYSYFKEMNPIVDREAGTITQSQEEMIKFRVETAGISYLDANKKRYLRKK